MAMVLQVVSAGKVSGHAGSNPRPDVRPARCRQGLDTSRGNALEPRLCEHR